MAGKFYERRPAWHEEELTSLAEHGEELDVWPSRPSRSSHQPFCSMLSLHPFPFRSLKSSLLDGFGEETQAENNNFRNKVK